MSSLDDDLYSADPNRFEEQVWGPDVWRMDPERHTPNTDKWAPPFADVEADYWEGWD